MAYLGLQSRCEDKRLGLRVTFRFLDTAVQKGLSVQFSQSLF